MIYWVQGEGERTHAARECKARSVLNKFKEMEQKVANGEEIDDPLCKYNYIIFMDFSPINTVNIPGYIYNLKQATGLVFYLLVMKPF